MEWWRPDLVLPAAGALAAGAAIGFEREYAGRPAGIRTHALLSLGCALLMLMAFHAGEWRGLNVPSQNLRIEPLRMVQAVLTGIGFLGGGVIFREGFSVHGLTTATSVWMSATLGLLFGSGFYELAVGGLVASLVLLALVRGLESRLPRQQITDICVRYGRADAPTEAEFADLAGGLDSRVTRVAYHLVEDGRMLERSAVLKTRGELRAELLMQRLRDDPRVLGFRLDPRGD
jgi:putative Mg2+ transporter-C (MgtC) family protein